jgi:hypothetical protein
MVGRIEGQEEELKIAAGCRGGASVRANEGPCLGAVA